VHYVPSCPVTRICVHVTACTCFMMMMMMECIDCTYENERYISALSSEFIMHMEACVLLMI